MNLRGLLSLETQRRVKLIEILYLSSTGLSKSQVAQLTKSSSVTLQQDIEYINLNYAPFEITMEDKFYKIIQQNEKGLDTLYKQVIDSSLEFQLFEMLFYEEYHTIADLADSLFTSVSSVYRIITKIEKALKPLNITIAKRPLRILGNEAVIRHLFGLFFREKKTPIIELAKNEKTRAAISGLINQFMELNNYYEAYITDVRVEYNFYVSLIRTFNGHFFDEKLIQSPAVKTPPVESWQAAILQIEKSFPLQFGLRFYQECFWLFYGDFLILDQEQMETALVENPRIAQLYDLADNLLDYIEDLSGDICFAEEKSRYGDLRTTLKIFLTNENYLYQYSPEFIAIIGEYRKSFISGVSELYAYQIQRLEQALKNFYSKNKKYKLTVSETIITNQMYVLVIHYPELMQKLSNSQEQIHILLLSLVYPMQDDFLKKALERNMTGNIKFLLINQMSQLRDEEFLKKIDLIISTSSLGDRFKDHSVFVVEPFPTLTSYNELQHLINTLIEKKHNLVLKSAAVPAKN